MIPNKHFNCPGCNVVIGYCQIVRGQANEDNTVNGMLSVCWTCGEAFYTIEEKGIITATKLTADDLEYLKETAEDLFKTIIKKQEEIRKSKQPQKN